MAETLPIFPLGTVMFPGVILPLHIFEDRYRELVRSLVALPEGRARRFGVVGIRHGHEVGGDETPVTYEVGCAAQLRRVQRHDDGRYDIVSVGTDRFRLLEIAEADTPYLTGVVEWLPEEPEPEPEAALLAESVLDRFRSYVDAIAALRGGEGDLGDLGDLPDDPATVSWLVASAALLTMADRQELLETVGVELRLRAEAVLLRRETTFVEVLGAVPAPLGDIVVTLSTN